MKKVIAILLTLGMALSVIACAPQQRPLPEEARRRSNGGSRR
jgi:hypothetical protein